MRSIFCLLLFLVSASAESLEDLSRETEETEIRLAEVREEVAKKKEELSLVEKEISDLDRKIKLQKEELIGLKEREYKVSLDIKNGEEELVRHRQKLKNVFKGIILKTNASLQGMMVGYFGAAEMGTYIKSISKFQGRLITSFGERLQALESQKADLLLMRDEKELVLKEQERNLSKVKELRSKRALELKDLEKKTAEIRSLLLALKQRSLRVQTALKGIGSSVIPKDSLKGLSKNGNRKPINGRITKDFNSKRAYQFVKVTAASQGIEMRGKAGDDVQSIARGKVTFAGPLPGYGRVVILDHGERYYSLYGNLGTISVSRGDLVDGKLGTLPDSGGLYFEIREKKNSVDPSEYLN